MISTKKTAITVIRHLFQWGVVLLCLVTGYRYAMGWSLTSIETYCPFGGLESALSLFTNKQFACATGERNLALFIALILLTLLARRAFCGWVCPVGTLSEMFAYLGRKIFPRKRKDSDGYTCHALEPSRRIDQMLKWLKLPVLLIILFLTFKTGELIFRGVDPYYILFSFHGHDVQYWSYIVLAGVLIGIVVMPMAWCRYLCPLGAALWPFAAISRLRIHRNDQTCTHCGACDRVCPYSLPISKKSQMKSGDCTLCFKCMNACPEPDTLELKLGGRQQ